MCVCVFFSVLYNDGGDTEHSCTNASYKMVYTVLSSIFLAVTLYACVFCVVLRASRSPTHILALIFIHNNAEKENYADDVPRETCRAGEQSRINGLNHIS